MLCLVLGWLLFPFCYGGGELPFLTGLYLATEEGDQMQLYPEDGDVRVFLFLDDGNLKLRTTVTGVAVRPDQEVRWAEIEPRDQLYPVWKTTSDDPTNAEEPVNGRIDLARIAEGKAAVEAFGRKRVFRRVAEHRIFTIGDGEKRGAIQTGAAFPVLYGPAFEKVPFEEDLSFFLTNRNAEIAQNFRMQLRSKNHREHFVVVYPLKITADSVGLLAVERLYVGGAHGSYELTSFSYSREEGEWRERNWEAEIWANPDLRRKFEAASDVLASRWGETTWTAEETGWVATPSAGGILVKFGTYVMIGFAGGMPEMYLELEGKR